jgi:hypothetical protein
VCRGERGKERRQRASDAYKIARTKERRLFRKKARIDEEASIEIERHRSIEDARKFYNSLNDVRRPFEPQVAMCRAENGELITKEKTKCWRDGNDILKNP